MQSHNGDIELSVTLSTKGIESDAKKIKQEIEKDLSKTDVKVDFGAKKETEEYKQLNKELEHLNQMRDKLINKQQDMLAVGKGDTKQFQGTEAQIEALGKTIEQVKLDIQDLVNSGRAFEIVEDETAKEMARLQEVIDRDRALLQAETEALQDVQTAMQTSNAPAYVYPELNAGNIEQETQKIYDELNGAKEATDGVSQSMSEAQLNTQAALDSINAYKSGMQNTEDVAKNLAYDLQQFDAGFRYSDEFVELKKVSDSLTKQFNNITTKMHEMELLGESDSEKYQEMAVKAANIADALRDTNGQMVAMRNNGTAYVEGIDEAQYKNVEKQYNILADKMGLMRHEEDKTSESTDRATRSNRAYAKSIQNVSKLLTRLVGSGLALIPKTFKMITRSMKDTQKHTHKLGMGFKRILMYTLGIRGVYGLFRKLRSAIKEGVKNVALWRDGNNKTNESLSNLTSSLTYLKNAWGAAFSPIVNYVAPVLDKLIRIVADTTNALSYLFARLTGQSTWMKAIRVQKNYAESLKGSGSAAKEAEESLAQYDKLVMVNKQNSSGASSANNTDEMFEEMSIDDAVDWVDDFLAKLKDAWNKADFTDIGNIIGVRLKDLLDSISWDVIKNFVEKSAKSLATLFNGFFETAGLAESIGKTIAEAYNTIFDFVDKFVHTLHWDSIGNFIGEGLFSFIDTFDAKLAGSAIGGTIRGFIDMIYSALTTFSEGDGDIGGFELLGQKIADFVNTFVEEMNRLDEAGKSGWDKLGESLHGAVSGIFTALQKAIEGIDDENGWKKIGKGIGEVIKKIDFLQLGIELADVANSLVEALAKAIVEFAVTAPLETAIASIIGLAVVAAVASGVEVSAITIFIAAATVVLGFNLGELIGKALFPDDAMWYEEFNWTEFFNENELQDVLDGIDLMLLTFSDNVVSILTMLSDDAVFWWIEGTKADLGDFVFWWSDIWDTIKEPLNNIFKFFVYLATINISGPLASLDNFFKVIKDNSETIKPLFENLMKTMVFLATISFAAPLAAFDNFFKTIKDNIDNVKITFTATLKAIVFLLTINVALALSSIDNFFKSVSEFLPKLLDDLAFWWSDILNMLSVWLEDIGFWWNDILEGAKALLADCLFWIDDFFNNTLEYAENFGGDLELVLNNIIGFIEQVINSAIDGINALLSTIGSIDLDFSGLPSVIQDKIGTGISFDLPTFSHVSIPRLAQGAVIPPNKEFLAMLGDQKQGTNIETPLETMMEAFRAVLAENGSTNNEPIVLQLNGKVIAQAVWDEERKKYKQTGSYAY